MAPAQRTLRDDARTRYARQMTDPSILKPPSDGQTAERGLWLAPRFGPDGLVPVVTTHAHTGAVLMLAWMNAEALTLTLETGTAHYWSRSRQTLWKKGESSGQLQVVEELLVDCDQDAIVLRVTPGGDGGCCHVGFASCFYRAADRDAQTGRLKVVLAPPADWVPIED
jgi:phosphoribosyl-AMP cyclohydrolase